ncbi:MAG TPA: heme o synthase [Pseudogracilibacillus sp.]|nr:heme o synthase [Pseudogracilibacillus sp.]
MDLNKENLSYKEFFSDLKLLVKGKVLLANVSPVILGYWLALHFTGADLIMRWEELVIVTIGSLFVIAGALILNNWYEVDLDTAMMRTQARPTVTGNFPLKMVFWLGIGLSVLGMIIIAMTTLEAAIYALLGWFTYVVLYTFWSKRKYTLNTVIGSISGAFTPLIGWATLTPANHIVPITLFMILFLWQIPHTFAIAMRRHDEYKAAGVPMLPVVYGAEMTKRQSLIYILLLFPLPFFLGELGTSFLFISTIMNLIWIVISIKGFFVKDNMKWANQMFYYSLTYLTVVFGGMIIVTLWS